MAADRVADSGVRVSCAGHFLARRGASTTSPRAPRQILVPDLLLTRRDAGGAHVSAGATGRGMELRLPHQEMGGGSADVGAIHQQAYQHCVDLTIRPRQHRGERLRADSFACCTVLEAGCHVARAHLSKPPLGSKTEQRRCHAVDASFGGRGADEARHRRRIRRRAPFDSRTGQFDQRTAPCSGHERLRIGLDRRIPARRWLRLVARRVGWIVRIGYGMRRAWRRVGMRRLWWERRNGHGARGVQGARPSRCTGARVHGCTGARVRRLRRHGSRSSFFVSRDRRRWVVSVAAGTM
jgi:hypothetical protein